MRVKVLLGLSVVAVVAFFAFSLRPVPDPLPGVYSVTKNGFTFSIVLHNDGRHTQTLITPDGKRYSSEGIWRTVDIGRNKYLAANNVYLGELCSAYRKLPGNAPIREEINVPIYLSFGLQTTILICSEGRGLVRE